MQLAANDPQILQDPNLQQTLMQMFGTNNCSIGKL